MGQFLGWQSYARFTYCRDCGERWPSDEGSEHFCEEEFVKQSAETIEEMKRESCYLSDGEEEDEDGN